MSRGEINMAKLEVLRFPDERLRTIAKPVASVDQSIKDIVADMFETMYAEEGIGLAATQVDIHQRIVVIDVSEDTRTYRSHQSGNQKPRFDRDWRGLFICSWLPSVGWSCWISHSQSSRRGWPTFWA